MRLYHERQGPLTGDLDGRDEEECFTPQGRRVGVWLTTEAATGPQVFEAEVDATAIETFEVTEPGSDHRVFVVPGPVVAGLGFQTS